MAGIESFDIRLWSLHISGKTILEHAIKEKIFKQEEDSTDSRKKGRDEEARQVASGKEAQELHYEKAGEESSEAG